MNYKIRVATPEDAKVVHDIYGSYVDEEHVTFTTVNPSVDEYREKIIHTLEQYPFYIAESAEGEVLGYVYASSLRPHDAYRWNVESTIVLAPTTPRRQGIATALYNKLFDSLKAQGYMYVYGVVVDSNEASIALHKALEFEEVGHFTDIGYRDDKWKGIIWFRKQIGDLKSPSEPKPFGSVYHTE